MSLEELNQKVYDPKYQAKDPDTNLPFTPTSTIPEGVLPHTPEQPNDAWTESSFPVREKPAFAETLKGFSPKKKIAVGVGALAILLILVGGFYKVRMMAFSNEQVTVSINAPEMIDGSSEARFQLTYTNKNSAGIDEALLVISHPESFKVDAQSGWKTTATRIEIPLGKIAGNTTGNVTLIGRFRASASQSVGVQATLQFQPTGSSSLYESSARWAGNILRQPLLLEITAPLQAADGQTVEYIVRYKNEGIDTYENLRLILEYPEGFTFASSEPRPTDAPTGFYIGTLQAGQEATTKIIGTLNGARDDVKKITARIGKPQGDGSFIAYGETEQRVRIIASPFVISQTMNGGRDGAVRPGERLGFIVSFENDGEIGLRDVQLSVALDPTYLDLSTLELDRGTYQNTTRQILFKASDIPQLARLEPGASGKASFSIAVKSNAVAIAAGQKNVSFETVARIDSPDVPTPIGANKTVASNVLQVKLLTGVTMNVFGLYTDSAYPNSGPMPPKIGEETTYTLHVKLASDLNDITRGRVALRIPSSIRYIGSLVGERETVRWNERAGELVWEVGTLLAGNERELVFRVGMTPDETYNNSQAIRLVYDGDFTGRDDFAEQDFRVPSSTVMLEANQQVMTSGTVQQ